MKKKRVLILFGHGSAPGLHCYGSAQRSEHLLKALQAEAHCDVVVLHEDDTGPSSAGELAPLRDLLRPDEQLHYFYKKLQPVSRIRQLFRMRYGLLGIGTARYIFRDQKVNSFTEVHDLLASVQYDAIIVRYITTGVRADLYGKTSVPVLLDVDDSPLELIDTKASKWMRYSPLYGAGKRIAKKWMSSVLKECRHAWWVKQTDMQPFEQACRNSLLANSPVFPAEPLPYPKLDEGFRVLFVGLISYSPNRNGLLHFLEQVWPLVIQQVPGAELCVIGKGADDELLQAMENVGQVSYHGFQQDLKPFYQACAVSICPIYKGGGSKIKVLESLAYGRPVVLTSHAIEGVDGLLDESQGLLLARSDQEFAERIVQVRDQNEWAEEASIKGAESVREMFSNELFFKQVQGALR